MTATRRRLASEGSAAPSTTPASPRASPATAPSSSSSPPTAWPAPVSSSATRGRPPAGVRGSHRPGHRRAEGPHARCERASRGRRDRGRVPVMEGDDRSEPPAEPASARMGARRAVYVVGALAAVIGCLWYQSRDAVRDYRQSTARRDGGTAVIVRPGHTGDLAGADWRLVSIAAGSANSRRPPGPRWCTPSSPSHPGTRPPATASGTAPSGPETPRDACGSPTRRSPTLARSPGRHRLLRPGAPVRAARTRRHRAGPGQLPRSPRRRPLVAARGADGVVGLEAVPQVRSVTGSPGTGGPDGPPAGPARRRARS